MHKQTKTLILVLVKDTRSRCSSIVRSCLVASSSVGCFVNKLGSNVGDFQRLNDAIDLFNENGYRVSTINIGPTDIFGNNNVLELLQDEIFRECLSKVTTIQFVTTLSEQIDLRVIDLLNSIPKKEGFMYDCNVVVEHPIVWGSLQSRLNMLNLFEDDLNYYFVYNMGNDDEDNEKVLDLSKVTDRYFDTILHSTHHSFAHPRVKCKSI